MPFFLPSMTFWSLINQMYSETTTLVDWINFNWSQHCTRHSIYTQLTLCKNTDHKLTSEKGSRKHSEHSTNQMKFQSISLANYWQLQRYNCQVSNAFILLSTCLLLKFVFQLACWNNNTHTNSSSSLQLNSPEIYFVSARAVCLCFVFRGKNNWPEEGCFVRLVAFALEFVLVCVHFTLHLHQRSKYHRRKAISLK